MGLLDGLRRCAPLSAMNSRKPEIQNAPIRKEEFAQRWGISTRSVDRLINKGMPVVKLGHRTVRVIPLAADAYLASKFGR